MDSILITGGCGFIGSHTCLNLLDSGKYLIVIDNNINSYAETLNSIKKILKKKFFDLNERLIFFKGDIRSHNFLRNVFDFAKNKGRVINSVIHFAGLKAVGESVNLPMKYWSANVSGSITLFEIMLEYDCKTIVFSSSASVYGSNVEKFLTESSELNPCNPYAKTKLAIEIILEDIFNSSINDWRIAILRYFNPIGAHDSGLMGESPSGVPNNLFPYICSVAKGRYKNLKIFGKDWPTSDGTGVRDYIHIMDLADSHKVALEYITNNNPQILKLNIGTGKGTSVLDLVKIFKKTNSCEINYVFENRRPGDVDVVIADNKLALAKLNWKPQKTLEDMCRDAWRWENYRDNV